MCFSEGVGHTTAEDETVYFAEQVLDDTDLGGYFRTAHDSHERTFDVTEHSVYSGYLFLHEETEHLVVCIEIVCDDSGRSMFAVSSTECIHYVAVSVRSEDLSELFLTALHLFLGSLISGIFFLDTYYLTRFEGSSLLLCFRAVLSELNRTTECSSYRVFDLTEAELSLHFAFGFTHVAHDNERTTFIEDVLEGRQRTADTGVVCDLTVLVQWYIEVHTYNRFLTSEFKIFNCHNSKYLVC